MSDAQMNPSSDVKKKQIRNLGLVASVLAIILVGLYMLMATHAPAPADHKKMESVPFASSTSHIDAQTLWMERAQNDLKGQTKQLGELKQTVETLQKNDNQKTIEGDPRYQALQLQVQALQKAVQASPDDKGSGILNERDRETGGNIFPTTPGVQMGQGRGGSRSALPSNLANGVDAISNVGIDNDVITLKPKAGTTLPIKNADTYVPAGTFAEAIMLGAADASAGVNSQAKPVPMLFRLIADGTLPSHQKSHLKECVAIGAVTGDISSERGEIRVERLSCTFPNGEMVEQVVDGTVFGMDAKNGIRGNPSWREGDLLARAAMAGSLSGLANGVSQGYTTQSISPLGSTQTVDNNAIFKNGLASGASNAMEKLADYNIKRAEQYHPVIQISAGQTVDVVFLRGFYLDGKKHDEGDTSTDKTSTPELFPRASSGIESRIAPIREWSSANLTLSDSEMQKIKQHEGALTRNAQR